MRTRLRTTSCWFILVAGTGSAYGQTGAPVGLEELHAKIIQELESLSSLAAEVEVREVAREGAGPPPPPTLLRVSMARGGKFLVRAYRNDVELSGLASDGAQVIEWDCGAKKWTRYAATDPAYGGQGVRVAADQQSGWPSGKSVLGRFLTPWLSKPSGYEWFLQRLRMLDEATVTAQQVEGRACYVVKGSKTQTASFVTVIMSLHCAFDQETFLPILEDLDYSLKGVPAGAVVSGLPASYSMHFCYAASAPELESELARLEPPEGFTFVDPASLGRPGLALVGKPVPDWKLTTLDGEEIALVPKGDARCVLILAWATWCNPCRVEKEALARLAADGELKHVRVVTVSVDQSIDVVRKHLATHPVPFAAAWDPKFSEKVGTQGVPVTLLIDSKGVVRDGWTGFGEGERPIQKLKAAIDACRK